MAADAFIDTNVLLYLISADAAKADRAEALLLERPRISVQVLNEFTNVARRKSGLEWNEVEEALEVFKAACDVHPLTLETHEQAVRLASRHSFSFYDALIVASALLADCATLWSEDMQDGLLVDDRLRIRNPFLASSP
ncbi:MAG: PIN domain-containing protein [Pseudomonadota bacterium]